MHTGFGGKPEGKRQLGTPWHRWEDNIKTDLQEMDRRVWTGLFWIRTWICTWAVVEKGNDPLGSIRCREFHDWLRNCQLLKDSMK